MAAQCSNNFVNCFFLFYYIETVYLAQCNSLKFRADIYMVLNATTKVLNFKLSK